MLYLTISSDSLKGALIAAASAGAAKGLDTVWGGSTDIANGQTTGFNLSDWGDTGRFVGQRASQAVVDAGLQTAIAGGEFDEHLRQTLQGAASTVLEATLFNQVGDLGERYPELLADGEGGKIALHALAGGLAAEATGGDFSTGAAAAGANEALVKQLDTLVANDPQLLVAASKLTGLMAAGLVDGDVAQGAEIAGNATAYNYLTHRQVAKYVEEAKDCEVRGDCDQVQEKYRQLSLDQQDELIEACAGDRQGCAARYQPLVEDSQRFREELDKLGGSELSLQISLDAGPLLGQYMEAESVVSQGGFAQFLQDRHGLDSEQASVLSAMAAGVLPLGSKRLQLNQPKNPEYQPVRNTPTSIAGREYSGHALDRMQDRGIMPSIIENTIRNGQSYPSRGGTTVFYSPKNNISVVVNSKGDVVTTRYGR